MLSLIKKNLDIMIALFLIIVNTIFTIDKLLLLVFFSVLSFYSLFKNEKLFSFSRIILIMFLIVNIEVSLSPGLLTIFIVLVAEYKISFNINSFSNFKPTNTFIKIDTKKNFVCLLFIIIPVHLFVLVFNLNELLSYLLIITELTIILLFYKQHKQFNESQKTYEMQIKDYILNYAPLYALYFSAPLGGTYQATMWIDILEKIEGNFLIILRESTHYDIIKKLTNTPIVVLNRVKQLDLIDCSTLKTIYYVNNGIKNSQMVKKHQYTHVQLLHGDSDKAPSYNPVTNIFDKIFVAGQLGIDRYKNHGVIINREKFEIVGRPQLDDIKVALDNDNKTILYTPTWKGYTADSSYSSLDYAKDLVDYILTLKDVTLIIKPHPFTYKDKSHALIANDLKDKLNSHNDEHGTKHIFINALKPEMTLNECFNKSDMMISDVSAVISDYLKSEKPICVTDMLNEQDNFHITFPISTVSYVLNNNFSNLKEIMNSMLFNDHMKTQRVDFKKYVLGDFPTESYTDEFFRTANELNK